MGLMQKYIRILRHLLNASGNPDKLVSCVKKIGGYFYKYSPN